MFTITLSINRTIRAINMSTENRAVCHVLWMVDVFTSGPWKRVGHCDYTDTLFTQAGKVGGGAWDSQSAIDSERVNTSRGNSERTAHVL